MHSTPYNPHNPYNPIQSHPIPYNSIQSHPIYAIQYIPTAVLTPTAAPIPTATLITTLTPIPTATLISTATLSMIGWYWMGLYTRLYMRLYEIV